MFAYGLFEKYKIKTYDEEKRKREKRKAMFAEIAVTAIVDQAGSVRTRGNTTNICRVRSHWSSFEP